MDLAPELEDEFLPRHSLNPGITALLAMAENNGISVWCLSNDVCLWSEKFRRNLGIEKFLEGSVISGDVGVRKPDKTIYEILIHSIDCKVGDILFVDDREKNIIASRNAGIETIMFNPETGFADPKNWISRQAL